MSEVQEIINNENINKEEEQEIKENTFDEKLIGDINDKNISNLISSSEPKDNKMRYFGIDLIRVIACFLVMQVHACELFYIDPNLAFARGENNIIPGIVNSFSRPCVPLFIMISGYLLLPIKTDYKTFLKKRFTRISFPFIAFCAFYDIYYFIVGDIDGKTMFKNFGKIFINYGTEIGHLWYMYMIMGVYLFIPIITPWVKSAKKEHFFYYLILWLISSFNTYIHLHFKEIWGEAYWNKNTIFQGFFGDFGYAVLGCFIKMHLKEYNFYILDIILYLIGTGISMFGYLYSRKTATKLDEIEVAWKFDSFNVIIATFGVFMLLRKVECKNKTISKIFNDIALKSYGMYLIHIFFMNFFKYVFDAPNKFYFWSVFVITILTFIVSYLVVKVISYIPYSQYIIG